MRTTSQRVDDMFGSSWTDDWGLAKIGKMTYFSVGNSWEEASQRGIRELDRWLYEYLAAEEKRVLIG